MSRKKWEEVEREKVEREGVRRTRRVGRELRIENKEYWGGYVVRKRK